MGFNTIFNREIGRMGRYRTFSFSILLLPIICFIFLSIVFFRGVPRDIPIAVLDNDNTSMSRQLSQMVDAGAIVKVSYNIASVEQGNQMMMEGLIDAIVVIDKGFERAILRGEQTSTPVFINGVNLLKSSLIEKSVSTTIQTYSAGVEIQKLQTKGISSRQAYSASMPISFEKHILFNPYTSYAYYLMPGFMPMLMLMFVIISAIFSIGIELKKGTAKQWIEQSGNNIFYAITGKLLPYTILYIVMAMLMNLIMFRYFNVPMNGSISMLIAGNLLFILAYQAMGVVIITVLCSLRLALSIGAGYSVLAFTFSGLSFPFIAMNPIVASLGNIFPFTFYMNLFISQALRGAPIYYSVVDLLALTLFVWASMLFLPRLKHISTTPKFWGRD